MSESIPSPVPAAFHSLENSKPLPEGVTVTLPAEGPGKVGKKPLAYPKPLNSNPSNSQGVVAAR
jgi:hypothetical protein